MKVRMLIERFVSVELEEGVGIEDFRDSMTDDLLDSQDAEHETSDGKFQYVPMEFTIHTFEEVGAPVVDDTDPAERKF